MTSPLGRWLDDAPCAYLVTSLDGTIRWTNQTLARWLGDPDLAGGVADTDVTGGAAARPIHDLLTPGGSIQYEAIAPSLTLSDRLNDVSLELRRRDGTTLFLLCHVAIDRPDGASGDGVEVHWAGFNVTDRRAYERELLVVQRRLGRLQDLSAALARATTVEGVADGTLRLLVDGVKADDGRLQVVDGEGRLRLVAARPAAPPGDDRYEASAAGHGDEVDAGHRANRAGDEVVAAALTERRPVYSSYPAQPAEGQLAVPRHVVALPLLGDAGVLGVLRFGLDRTRPHTDSERLLLTAAAEMCAQALERVQLLERMRDEVARNRDLSSLLHRVEEATTVGERAQLIADFVVPRYADYATIEVPDAFREPIGLRHRDPSLEPTLRWLRSTVSIPVEVPHSLASVRAARQPRVLNDIDPATFETYGLDDEQLAALRTLAPSAYLGLPLIARGRVIGSMMLVHSASGRRFTDGDVEFLGRLAESSALTLENARLYEHERDAAQRLQRALLPERLPRVGRVRLSSYYEAGHELNRIGGDWYDAFVLPGNRLGLAVGDVVGGGLGAATTMAQLRIALQAYALEGRGVAGSLDLLNQFADTVPGARASSVVYAELDLETMVLTYGCAGHPPPVLTVPGERPGLLWDGRGSLLGVGASLAKQAEVALPPGAELVLYTDGLVERRGQPLDVGLGALVETIAANPDGVAHPESLAKLMSAADHGDDTCVLTVRIRRAASSGR